MFKYLLICNFLIAPVLVQTEGCERHVARRFDNGQEYVVVYVKGPTHDRIKEEVYFENGQKDYEGYYRNGVEHGKWTYYWPTGEIKSEENYIRGKEDGVMYDYSELGVRVKEYRYSKGVLIEEIQL